ncbi:MAG: PadR family transcriptional regulator [Bacteroidota bacterium]
MQYKNLIKGTLQPIILKLLSEQGRMYGYEITQKVRELTSGKIEITEGALYPALHKLEIEGTLKTEKEYIGKRVRKYYSLTKKGDSVVRERVMELTDFVASMNVLLNAKHSVNASN